MAIFFSFPGNLGNREDPRKNPPHRGSILVGHNKGILWLYFLPITWPFKKLWGLAGKGAKKTLEATWKGFIVAIKRLFAAALRGMRIVFSALWSSLRGTPVAPTVASQRGCRGSLFIDIFPLQNLFPWCTLFLRRSQTSQLLLLHHFTTSHKRVSYSGYYLSFPN